MAMMKHISQNNTWFRVWKYITRPNFLGNGLAKTIDDHPKTMGNLKYQVLHYFLIQIPTTIIVACTFIAFMTFGWFSWYQFATIGSMYSDLMPHPLTRVFIILTMIPTGLIMLSMVLSIPSYIVSVIKKVNKKLMCLDGEPVFFGERDD